jgi:glycosyltransferase involved in cell wall biosynthesis
MWESTRINDVFIEQMNNMTAIIVPNQWNKANFERQGCETPIHVVNLFVDTGIFNYQAPVNKDRFVFGTANKDPRKRLEDVVRCFNKAFPDKKDVQLKIKISPKESYNKVFASNKIEICKESYTRHQLKSWYSNNDCFVSCVSAEGWGLMQHESMACGRPVIAAKYAGLSEFMTEDNSFCINYKEVPAEGYWKAPGAKWSKYDEEHLIESMRFAYNNPSIVEAKGKRASEDACRLNKEFFVANLLKVIEIYK